MTASGWMKLSEVARYWAAKQLTRIERNRNMISLRAPFACPDFTVRFEMQGNSAPSQRVDQAVTPLREVSGSLNLMSGTWCREGPHVTACFALPKGISHLDL